MELGRVLPYGLNMEASQMARKPYPSDVSDDEWAFVAPYLALMREDALQRTSCYGIAFWTCARHWLHCGRVGRREQPGLPGQPRMPNRSRSACTRPRPAVKDDPFCISWLAVVVSKATARRDRARLWQPPL